MKILYGVVGEGMGHAMRSTVVVQRLLGEGHEVEIVASQRAVDYLAARFPGVHRVHGMHIVTRENRVRRGDTLRSNVADALSALPGQIRAYFELIEDFEPECVVSDFESWTYLYGKAHRLPILSIDNNQMLNRCQHPPEFIERDRPAFEIARAFVKGKLPFCDHYLISTFFYPPLRKANTELVPPVLRPEILTAQVSKADHVLVYQTAEGNSQLAQVLRAVPGEFRVYGMRRDLRADLVDGNVTYRPFSEQRFIEDLASARAVISGGGFTLMSEAVYLKKPVLSTPIRRQYEQLLNALYLEKLGYGVCAESVTAATLAAFLADLPRHEEALAAYEQDGNAAFWRALDAQLDRAAAGLL